MFSRVQRPLISTGMPGQLVLPKQGKFVATLRYGCSAAATDSRAAATGFDSEGKTNFIRPLRGR
jgi:hypothetical protein